MTHGELRRRGSQHLGTGRCGGTHKVCFRSEDAALIAADDIIQERPSRHGGPVERRAYWCHFCGFWHLSSARRNRGGEAVAMTS